MQLARALRGRRLVAALCVLALASAAMTCAWGAEGDGAVSPICRLGKFSDRASRSAVTDSSWRQLVPGVIGSPVLNKPHRWALDFVWFQWPDSTGRLLTLTQLTELAARGAVNDSMQFDLVNYRCVVRADNVDEARRAAVAKHMDMPLHWVMKRLGVTASLSQ